VLVVLDLQIERKENLSLSFSFSIFGARALKSVCFTKVLLPLVCVFVSFSKLCWHPKHPKTPLDTLQFDIFIQKRQTRSLSLFLRLPPHKRAERVKEYSRARLVRNLLILIRA